VPVVVEISKKVTRASERELMTFRLLGDSFDRANVRSSSFEEGSQDRKTEMDDVAVACFAL